MIFKLSNKLWFCLVSHFHFHLRPAHLRSAAFLSSFSGGGWGGTKKFTNQSLLSSEEGKVSGSSRHVGLREVFPCEKFLSRAWRRFPAVFTLYNLINLSSYHNYIHNDRRWKESLLRLACFVVGEIIMWYTWQVFHNELTTSLALAMIFTIGNTCRHTGASQEIWNWF